MSFDLQHNFASLTGFDWEQRSLETSRKPRAVSRGEVEEIFFHRPMVMAFDKESTGTEPRWVALEHTEAGRDLAVVFTIRGNLVRIIAAHDMSPRERRLYEQATGQKR